MPNYNRYETKDGKYIAVGSLETKFRNALLKKLGREDLIADRGGITSSDVDETAGEVHSFFRKTFLTKTRDQWMEELAD
ncbi:MAG: CoA transferase [Deltaproteobacteria bacterium]|nr:CoA transferase [Deltaproteobacteria bacterium]